MPMMLLLLLKEEVVVVRDGRITVDVACTHEQVADGMTGQRDKVRSPRRKGKEAKRLGRC